MNIYSDMDEPLPDEMTAPMFLINGFSQPVCGHRRDSWYCIADPHGLDPAQHYYVWQPGVRANAG